MPSIPIVIRAKEVIEGPWWRGGLAGRGRRRRSMSARSTYAKNISQTTRRGPLPITFRARGQRRPESFLLNPPSFASARLPTRSGFQSLTHFNRIFRKLVGRISHAIPRPQRRAPLEYRAANGALIGFAWPRDSCRRKRLSQNRCTNSHIRLRAAQKELGEYQARCS